MKDAENLPMTSSLWGLGWERMIAFEVFNDWQKRGLGLDGKSGW